MLGETDNDLHRVNRLSRATNIWLLWVGLWLLLILAVAFHKTLSFRYGLGAACSLALTVYELHRLKNQNIRLGLPSKVNWMICGGFIALIPALIPATFAVKLVLRTSATQTQAIFIWVMAFIINLPLAHHLACPKRFERLPAAKLEAER
jgi:hypothetical protein